MPRGRAAAPKSGFGQLDVALKMRDVVDTMVKSTLDKERPRGKQAVVVDWDRDTLFAEVLFPGDETTVQASFPKNLQPKRRKNDNETGDAVGDIVQVEGKPGAYRITEIGGSARSEEDTLLNPLIITMQGIEEALLGMLPQPGDIRYTFRVVSGGGAVLEGNWVKLDNSLVLRTGVFENAWDALGNPTNGTDGTNWRVPDGRDRAPFGAGSIASLLGDDGAALGDRGFVHTHNIPPGGAHGHTHGHTHGVPSTNHAGNSTAQGGGATDRVTGVNGTTGGSHAHGGSTNLPGDDTTSTASDHDHSGDTGDSSTAAKKIGWKGVNWLMKL